MLVEDDRHLSSAIIDYLALEGIICDHADNGVTGMNIIEKNQYDVLILDINLPRKDGISLCKALRESGKSTPIIMLTAKASLDNKLAGFDAGTDDYLVKPFAMQELIARLKSLAGRVSSQHKKLVIADLELDFVQKKVCHKGITLKLSPISFKILEVLMRASPNPVERETLLDAIWGDDQPENNSLKVQIHNLRKLIDYNAEHPLIHTIKFVGYAIR